MKAAFGPTEGVVTHWQAERALRTRVRIAVGSCSPAAAERVYDRSKPLGPSTRSSQFAAADDPAIDTHHSPCRPLNACSRYAVISRHSWASTRFGRSIVTAIRRQSSARHTAHTWCKAVNTAQDGPVDSS